MNTPAKLHNITKIKKILQLQLIVILLGTSIVYMLWQKMSAQGFFTGAIIAWVGHFIFAYFSFKYIGAKAKNKIVSNMYRGHMLKWVITIICFIISVKIMPENVLFLIIGFSFSQINNWLFLLVK